MPEDLFNQLCLVRSFNKANGATYQEHILIVAGKRIPKDLHTSISKAKSGTLALEILKQHNIAYSHIYYHNKITQ